MKCVPHEAIERLRSDGKCGIEGKRSGVTRVLARFSVLSDIKPTRRRCRQILNTRGLKEHTHTHDRNVSADLAAGGRRAR